MTLPNDDAGVRRAQRAARARGIAGEKLGEIWWAFMLRGILAAVLGFVARRDTVGPWRISVAEVETPDGVVHNILPAVTESIGTIPRNFGPGDSVGDLCGGFGDPF